MIEDGYRPTTSGSMTSAAMAFMRDHGVLKDIYSESTGTAHKTAKGTKVSVRTVKAPGFGPKGVLRCILPFTIFLKLKDIGGNVLPPYDEEFREVAMDTAQAAAYRDLAGRLTAELKQALARRDTTLLGVVLNVLLAWPDCCFRSETVVHPRTRNTLAFVPAQFNEFEISPKERELIDICKEEKAQGRKVLAYTVYTGTRDTTSRLKVLLEQEGFKVAVLRASVDASRREDWIAEQLDRGIDVLITNPELVKTGLDLLEFPTIVFMQSGYNVYSLQQAARRSWRIGQKQPVRVIYLGYAPQMTSSQMTCLESGLMARRRSWSRSSTFGRRARIGARCPEPGCFRVISVPRCAFLGLLWSVLARHDCAGRARHPWELHADDRARQICFERPGDRVAVEPTPEPTRRRGSADLPADAPFREASHECSATFPAPDRRRGGAEPALALADRPQRHRGARLPGDARPGRPGAAGFPPATPGSAGDWPGRDDRGHPAASCRRNGR
jgi:hypothetical protein